MRFYYFHGNFQTTRVWDFARVALPGESRAVDIWKNPARSPAAWAQSFCAEVERDSGIDGPCVLVGYSLGGRLAMQALAEAPGLWSAAILIGAHPGSDDPELRQAWLDNDVRWAKRFASEPWARLMADWNTQAVFGGVPNPHPPREEDFDRALLAEALVCYSKGNQECLSRTLAAMDCPPVLYLSGELDRVYTRLGAELDARLPSVSHVIVPGAGHRVPWEQPDAFLRLADDFITELE